MRAMGNRNNLIALGSDAPQPDAGTLSHAEAEEMLTPEQPAEEWFEEEPARARFGWVPAAVALLAVAGWTGFFGWVHGPAMASGTPAEWARWIVDWSMPVALVVGLWLLAMRHSRREAARFADAASSLAREAAALETRLLTVNRELSLARDFIAAQSRDLESLGRIAAERISTHAEHLQGLIRGNGEQVEQIARVSTTARENMDRLRDELPVISNAARDVASQIGQAGNLAQGQLGDLVAGFTRLNDFGEASGRQVATLRGQVDEAIAGFEAQIARMEEFTASRFGQLAERSAAFRAELDGREVEAFAAMRRRADALAEEVTAQQQALAQREEAGIAALQERAAALQAQVDALAGSVEKGQSESAHRWSEAIESLQSRMVEAIRQIAEVDAKALDNARRRLSLLSEEATRVDNAMTSRLQIFHQEVARRHDEADAREAAALATLRERLAQLDAEVLQRANEQRAAVEGFTATGEAMTTRMAELALEMDRITAQSDDASLSLGDAASALISRLSEMGTAVEQSRKGVAQLTDDSVRLLELIRSGADHSSKDLPLALSAAETRLRAFRDELQELHGTVRDAGERSETLLGNLRGARGEGAEAREEMAALEERLAEIARTSQAIAERTRAEMQSAANALEQAAVTHLATLREGQVVEIRSLAERIAGESSEAIGDALLRHANEAIAELRSAADAAGDHGREAAALLRDQLVKVNELTGNLERRVAHARAKAQEQMDNDFSRRMALITESLNSAAIDIARAFDAEVTDTAWAGYLRGDRGIFTRRAVRLLDGPALRGVSDHYDEDREFRESVNRYIHDFEAMLRSVLSTRDGNALAITLLSSDIGKLYVVLAQAIERLRD